MFLVSLPSSQLVLMNANGSTFQQYQSTLISSQFFSLAIMITQPRLNTRLQDDVGYTFLHNDV